MAGSLVKIDEEIVTSAVASVTLGGSDWDSSYDVYMVRLNNINPTTDGAVFYARVTESGTPNTTANYDNAFKRLRADASFGNGYNTNSTIWSEAQADSTTGTFNSIYYLYNFNNSSEYSFITRDSAWILQTTGYLFGYSGGGVFKSASACDGIHIFFSSGNIANGTFTLFKVL